MPGSVVVIGSGIGGLAVSIRLAKQGYKVVLLEKNDYPGGKLSEFTLNGFRFDKGPSLFTMPQLIDELTALSGSSKKFEYTQLTDICHYFYEDGTQLTASSNIRDFANELGQKLGEDPKAVVKHLETSSYYYKITAPLFLERSLHVRKNFFNSETLRGILHAPFLKLFTTMHKANSQRFKNKKTVQLFDRYATYNGSDPYKAPALLNIIPHLEYGMGAYLPAKGMYEITRHLQSLATELGVELRLKSDVKEIVVENKKIKGVRLADGVIPADLVISDVDIHHLYGQLLQEQFAPMKLLRQEKSSSAFVFYWGILKEFKQLGLHNIFFSSDYRDEFHRLFNNDAPTQDPTIYINITSKLVAGDAPDGMENWFVMVNVPHNKNRKEVNYAKELRANVLSKLNRLLKTDLEPLIVCEEVLSPYQIEMQTSSIGGSLYGNASNDRFSAFLRHANYSSDIKGLYLVGGSVHPGGGIPLCLYSAKIAAELIKEREG